MILEYTKNTYNIKDHNKGHIKRPYVHLTLFDLWGFIFELKVPYFSAIMQKMFLCGNKKCLFCPEYHLLCHKNYKADDSVLTLHNCDTTCQVWSTSLLVKPILIWIYKLSNKNCFYRIKPKHYL